MKLYIILIAVLIALSGTAYATDIANPRTIGSGEIFIVSSGDILRITEGSNLNIDMGGTLIIEEGGGISNSGDIINFGVIDSSSYISNDGNIFNSGNIEIKQYSPHAGYIVFPTIFLTSNLYNFGNIENSGNINNSGNISNYGTINSVDGSITNKGTINKYPSSSFSGWVNGVLVNTVTITNPGTIKRGETFNVHDNENLIIPYGETLVIESGGHLVLESGSSIGGSIDYYGSTHGGTIYNIGSIENAGIIWVDYINNYGSIKNSGSIEQLTTFESTGNIDTSGELVLSYGYNSGTIKNSGYLYYGTLGFNNTGTILNSGFSLNDNGMVLNFGSIFNSGTMHNMDGHNENHGTIDNSGTISCVMGSLFDNFGIINTSGTVALSMDDTIRNFATIDNSGTISSQFGYIINEGTINNSGTILDELFILYNEGSEFINNKGTINNCTTGIINALIKGNPVNTVICTGENTPVTSITVTGAATTVENGKTLQMTATVNPTTATNKDVTWSVISGTGAATISQTGLLTATKAGTVTVKATAKDSSGVQGSLAVTVTEIPPTLIPVTDVELSAAATTVEVGKSLQMTATVNPTTATNKNIVWSVVAGTGNATIGATGLLTGTKSGTVTVKATALDGSGVEGSILITIAEEIVPVTSITVKGATTVENGKTLQMTATVMPVTATNKDVTWSVVAGTGNATISPTGLLTGTKTGTVTIKALAKDGSGVQGSSVVTVIEIPVTGIALSEATTTVETGKALQMVATIYPENATNKNVLWSVESVTGDAVISNTGVLTGKAVGNVTVRVTSVVNTSVKDALNITVTAAKTVSSKSGGGGGSGGSGSSGEKTQNIAVKDVSSIFVGKGSVRFDFKDPDNDVQYIEYKALKNSGTITATVEVLKDKSTFAASSAEGVIYRHVNIWLGKTGYATETNIEGPVIGFRVDRSWIEGNSIDPASVALNRYSDDEWTALPTTQTKSDEKYYYYQAQTPGFSPFAITGLSLDEAALRSTSNVTFSADEGDTPEDSVGNEAQAENSLPGLSVTLTLLIVSIACFLKRKQ